MRVCGPPTLIPKHIASLGVEVSHDVEACLRWCDAANVLRIQLERQEIPYLPSLREYAQYYGINAAMLNRIENRSLLCIPGLSTEE